MDYRSTSHSISVEDVPLVPDRRNAATVSSARRAVAGPAFVVAALALVFAVFAIYAQSDRFAQVRRSATTTRGVALNVSFDVER